MTRVAAQLGTTCARVLAPGLCALALLGGRALAQEGPYSNFLVGERSLGLAGAFVAVADDASAIFHNPGGLASQPTGSASGSLWTLVRGTRLVENGYVTDLGSADLEHSAPMSLPLFLAGVLKFGPKAKDRVRPHALSAAILTPHNVERRFVAQLDEMGAADRLEVRSEDRARWLGLGYGVRPHRRLSLGVSSFLALRSMQHDEVELRARETAPVDSTFGSTLSHASTLQVDTQHVVIRVGLQAKLARELQGGLMFQVPGIEIDESAHAESLVTRAGPDPTTVSVLREGNLTANVPMPWELRAGMAWVKRRHQALISLDLSLFGPAGAESDPLPLVESDTVELGAFVPVATYRRTSLRGALGFEALIGDLLPIRGGVFFERSSAPAVVPMSDSYSRDDIDTAGAAFSLGVRTADFDLSVGATGALGFGRGLGLLRDEDFDGPLGYRSAKVQDTFLMIFVGGAKSAVREIVTAVVE
jgi:hypothetical protein